MRAYSVDLRERIVAALDSGERPAEVARRFRVSRRTVHRYRRQVRQRGTLVPRTSPGRRPLLDGKARAELGRQVEANPDATLDEHVQTWFEHSGQWMSTQTMSRMLRDLGWTLKRLSASEADPDQRQAWWEAVATVDPERFVFVDESAATIRLTPVMGRAPRNERCVGTVPRNWGHSTTVLAALDRTGMTSALVVEGAADRPVFDTFVEQVLAPRLKPGQIVVWDNLSVHKSPRARQAIEACGCELWFLPPYSPDFNPIEQAFSKLKTALRRAQQRTRDGLWAAIGHGLDQITAADATGWFRHCGYRLASQSF